LGTTPRDAAGPPRWLAALTWAALVALLYYPVHRPYQNPDQDHPALTLLELVRGGWEPWTIHYPALLNNVLRAGYELLLAGAWLVGRPLTAIDLYAAYTRDPVPFRIAARLIAMTCGVVSLVAAARLTERVADRWSGLGAAALLGTAYMFVREHHHGMYDAPAATAIMVCLYYSGRYVLWPATGTLVAAAVAAAFALASKYNAAVVGASVLLALWLGPAPWAMRGRRLALGAVAGIGALLVANPVMVLEPVRVVGHVARLFEFFGALRTVAAAQGGPRYDMGDVLQNGLGMPLLAAALLGVGMALVRRERALMPLLLFVAIYGWLIHDAALGFNRYALPLAAPVAVLAAYGFHHALGVRLRMVAIATLVAVGLPWCVAYDRLIAHEDTRVAAARWLVEHVRPEAAVVMPGNFLSTLYVGPALPGPLVFKGLPPDVTAEMEKRAAPRFPRTPRFLRKPRGYDASPEGPGRLALWANSVVVTSEMYEGVFEQDSTPITLVEDLERFAVLLADFPVVARPGARVYEPDMNYAPMRGMTTLARPGPRLRIWYVPAPAGRDAPSPFVDGHRP
jgi:hypothetical protein